MIPEELSLHGKVAIVAGDGRIWSKTVALALAEAGADVAIAAPKTSGIAETADGVRKLGKKAMTVAIDITKAVEVESMVTKVVSELGRVDILVNSADLQFAKPLIEVTPSEWQQVLDVNLTAVFLCCQAVGKRMLEQKKGRIITLTSGLGERGLPNCTAYCASKGAVVQFTKALALEWGKDNIRVNAIGLGWMAEGEVSEEESEEPLVRYIPLRRRGRPADLEGLVVYLASDASDYVTGQTYFLDGGVLAHP